jgi:hypothetical protein
MNKIDLPILFITYLLRMTHLFLLLYVKVSSRLYNYWFHTCDVKDLSSDFFRWMVYLFSTASCWMLHGLHFLFKLIVGSIQLLPCWSLCFFWLCLYYLILIDPKCWTFVQMFTDPRYQGTAFPSRARVSRHTWHQFISKKKIKINPTRLKHGVNSGYESQ